jgi:DNA-binding MarR family transcriptional regulator
MEIENVIRSSQRIEIHEKTIINLMYTSRQLEQSVLHFKKYDISAQQYNVLRILRGQKGNPANLSTLQERMIDKNSNTTRLVDKLLIKELVERNQCTSNRRKIEIFITKKGIELLKIVDPIVSKHNKENTKNLNHTELIILNNLLDKLRNDA